MSFEDTEAAALSEQLEDESLLVRRKPARKPSYRYFGIRFSQWGQEYKSYCYLCDYQSSYGTRGKAAKSASAHVSAVHNLDGWEEKQ